MSRNRKLVKVIRKIYHNLYSFYAALRKKLFRLLRTFLVAKNRQKHRTANAGFVLPTVAMVSLVVVLLTVAILFRSFERSKNATNVRVNEITLKAATPAIDRAKAKIDKLLSPDNLELTSRTTPSDFDLYKAFSKQDNLKKYTFGDETPLSVNYGGSSTNEDESTPLEERTKLNTAWRYPIDTDNNGKYDSYTIYGILFRSPPVDGTTSKFKRSRNPLDARTPPMDDVFSDPTCPTSSVATEGGWYKAGPTLKKSFFVYAVNVPISVPENTGEEVNKGNKGFSAIEFQQDQERIPLINNAVVYEDDLQVSPGAGLKLNGRVFTNSNLLTAQTDKKAIRFYQVSDPLSCFYKADASKVIVGGNVGNGRITGQGEDSTVTFDLFAPKAEGGSKLVKNENQSVSNTTAQIAYNSLGFATRINTLIEAQIKNTDDPLEVKKSVDTRVKKGEDAVDVRREELEAYFKKRTIKVPFAVTDPTLGFKLEGSGDTLRGTDAWIDPLPANTKLTFITGGKEQEKGLAATEPNKLKEEDKEKETYLGDRIIVGNNLPALWFNKKSKSFVGTKVPQELDPQEEWTKWSKDEYKYRYRKTQIQELLSLADATERNKLFEEKAAEAPKNGLDNAGGMRVVTGAGIYVDGTAADSASFPWDSATDLDKSTNGDQKGSYLASNRPSFDTNFVDTTNTNTDGKKIRLDQLIFDSKPAIPVWSDAMPMTGGKNVPVEMKGDLLMRASAVYHYKVSKDKDQLPIACVSSYYDPTNAITAQNNSNVVDKWKNPEAANTTDGKSNNGVVYPYNGRSQFATELARQARLVYPNGRFVNEPLRKALEKKGSNMLMADYSAIDTAICAIQILKGTPPNPEKVEHGTIYETAFLDARQVKSIETVPNVTEIEITPKVNEINSAAQYGRSIEERQPLEVRVTVLDINKLRLKSITGSNGTPATEYLLPNSGIIYATRDDALLDLSNNLTPDNNKSKLISPTDYKLDSTRRPNGIMVINGQQLNRGTTNNYGDGVEKGLILATNVPAYIKGDFNLHAKNGDPTKPVEEFVNKLAINVADSDYSWSNFYTRANSTKDDKGRDNDFACRKGDPRLSDCKIGDTWRPATVLADSVTVLSDNFRFGFRNEGDYDLRNNEGDIKSVDYKQKGFFDNNYLTSSLWYKTTGVIDPRDFDGVKSNYQGSSYVNNFVTPIQRRVKFGEYLMEVCLKVPVSSCGADDWSLDGEGTQKATPDVVGKTYNISTYKAGTTVKLAENTDLQRYARRVAFVRNNSGFLILDSEKRPVPLGIDGTTIKAFPRNPVTDQSTWTVGVPPAVNAALWFRTTTNTGSLPDIANSNYGYEKHLFYTNPLTGTDKNEQPLLVPVLQIHVPSKDMSDPGKDTKFSDIAKGKAKDIDVNWFQNAVPTTTNLVIAGGDTPSRPNEYNGGLENFVRYLERWMKDKDENSHNHSLSGSLIQYKRSQYATAPWDTRLKTDTSIFGSDYNGNYPSDLSGGKTSFYTPPSRQWGFDVGLLSQLPDLFAQRFTLPPTSKPNEFFREVSRDDEWVKTLLCAKIASNDKPALPSERPKDFCNANTGG